MYFVASTKKRIVAHVIDWIIGSGFMIPVFIQVGWSFFGNKDIVINLYLLLGCIGFDMIQRTLFLKYVGATIGKLIVGLRVVNYDEKFSAISLSQAFIRVLSEKLSFFFSFSLYAFLFVNLQRRHLIDWLADTQVVQFFPRETAPKKRMIVGPILILSFLYNGLISAYETVSVLNIQNGNIVIEAQESSEFNFQFDFSPEFDEE